MNAASLVSIHFGVTELELFAYCVFVLIVIDCLYRDHLEMLENDPNFLDKL